MKFQFADFSSFLWMNGHGPFVWGCYAVVFIGLAFLALEPRFQRQRFIKQQKNLARRNLSQSASEQSSGPL
jgi:heme exporter protein D